MSRWEWDRLLKWQVEQLEKRETKNTPSLTPVHRAVVATWRELRRAITTARAVGAQLVVRTLVSPGEGHTTQPRVEPEPARDPGSGQPVDLTNNLRTQPAHLVGPQGFAVDARHMRLDQLYARARLDIPLAERRAIEDEINRRMRESRERPRLSQAEHEAISRGGYTCWFDFDRGEWVIPVRNMVH